MGHKYSFIWKESDGTSVYHGTGKLIKAILWAIKFSKKQYTFKYRP